MPLTLRSALPVIGVTSVLIAAACSSDPEQDPASTDPGDGPVTTATTPPADGDESTEAPTTGPDDTSTTEPPDDAAGEEPAEESTPEPDPPAEPKTVTIGAAGDILPHARVLANASANAGGAPGEYDFTPMFAEVTDLLSAPEVSICHLETPLSTDNTNLTQPMTLVFNSPWQLADALASAGFDGCDFASNHTFDNGLAGVAQTETALADAGLAYAGPASTEQDAGRGAWYEVGDITVANLAYSYTVVNDGSANTYVPPEAPWMEQYLWLARGADGIISDAEQARADGADFVVLSMHWGSEYVATPTAEQQELATELLESEAVDLIIGTHVHVVQPCQEINGRYVLYGMGNFLSNQSPTQDYRLLPETQDGLIAHVELHRDTDGEVSSTLQVQPTFVEIGQHIIQPVSPQANPESYQRTVDTLNLLGPGACSFEIID